MYRADGPQEMRPVGEVEFVQGLAAASASGLYGPGRAAGAIVGHANLNLGEQVAPVLDALQAASPNRFRGFRHSVTWDPHPEVDNTAAHRIERQLASGQFRTGARVLARKGLSLEGWLYFPQLPELTDEEPWVHFVKRLTAISQGRALYTTLERFGHYIIEDYVRYR